MSKAMAEGLRAWFALSQEERDEANRIWIEEFAKAEVEYGPDLPVWLQ